MENSIIKACLKNDRAAQKSLYEQYRIQMYVLCQRYCTSAEDAKDCLQEGFIKIYRDLYQFDPLKGKFEYWIKKVFVNTCLEAIRKKKIDFQSLDSTNNSQIASEESSISTLSLQELTKLIQTLPIGYRTVFNMYVIEGYSHAEIAEHLNISESTSKTQLMKAKSCLRQRLEESFNAQ